MNKVDLCHLISKTIGDEKSNSRKKLKYGVGINDAKNKVTLVVDGVKRICPAYVCWSDMLKRCYSKKFLASRPTYKGTSVCAEWRRFTSFRSWWLEHSIDGYHLDKDIVNLGNKVYSPEFCIFVPNRFNSLIVFSDAARGNCKLGVFFDKDYGKYRARCKSQISGVVEDLGAFDNEDDAHSAWLNRRLAIAEKLKGDMDAIDVRIYNGIVSHIINAK